MPFFKSYKSHGILNKIIILHQENFRYQINIFLATCVHACTQDSNMRSCKTGSLSPKSSDSPWKYLAEDNGQTTDSLLSRNPHNDAVGISGQPLPLPLTS